MDPRVGCADPSRTADLQTQAAVSTMQCAAGLRFLSDRYVDEASQEGRAPFDSEGFFKSEEAFLAQGGRQE